MKAPYQVIKKPLINEKTTILREGNKFTLVVDRNATKADIRQAAEEVFDIKGKILKVNTILVHGKTKGQLMRANRGRRPDIKKAILTVEAGTDIRLFENI